MSKIKAIIFGLAASLLGVQQVLASSCEINGKTVPCDQMPAWFPWVFILPFIIWFFMMILMIPLFVLWILMLLHAVKNQTDNKTAWVLILIFTNFVGAVIYYFAEKRPMDQKLKKTSKKV